MPHNKIPYILPHKDPEKIRKIIVDNDGSNSDIDADKLDNEHANYYLNNSDLNELLSNRIFNRLYLGRGSKAIFPFVNYISPTFPTIELSKPLFTDSFKGEIIKIEVSVKFNNSVIFTETFKGIELHKIIIPDTVYMGPGEYEVNFSEFTEHHIFINNNPVLLNIDDSVNNIKNPYVTIKGNENFAPVNLTIKTSSFVSLIGTDTHFATDWEIIDEYDKVVWASYLDKENLTSILVDENVLRKNRDYTIKVKHYGTKAASNASTLAIKTEFKNYSDAWSTVNNMKTSRVGHTLALLENDSVLAIGGTDNDLTILDTVEKFDIRNGTWEYFRSLPAKLTNAHATTLRNGDIMVVGGENNIGPNKNIFIYSIKNKNWITINNVVNLPLKASGILERLVETNREFNKDVLFYVSGRKAGEEPVVGDLNNVLLTVRKNNGSYDIEAKPLITGLNNYFNMASSLVQDDTILLTGGSVNYDIPNSISNLSLNYIPDNDIEQEGLWTAYTNLPIALYGHAQLLLEDFTILITGGRSSTETSKKVFIGTVTGQTITWEEQNELTIGLQHQSAILLKDGRAMVTGGVTIDNVVTNICLLYT